MRSNNGCFPLINELKKRKSCSSSSDINAEMWDQTSDQNHVLCSQMCRFVCVILL